MTQIERMERIEALLKQVLEQGDNVMALNNRVEALLQHVLEEVVKLNRRLDLVCGHELKEPEQTLRFFGEVPL